MFLSRFAKKRSMSILSNTVQGTTTYRSMFNATRALMKPSTMYSQESFANGSNSIYFDQMFSQWKKDPESVHPSFNAYFTNVEAGQDSAYQAPPTIGQKSDDIIDQVLKALGN